MLKKIVSIEVPGRRDAFRPRDVVKKDGDVYAGIAPLLGQEMSGTAEYLIPAARIDFLRSDDEISEAVPPEIYSPQGLGLEPLNWWWLHQALSDPTLGLFHAVEDFAQLGCMTRDLARPVRVKVDWAGGHSLGLRPEEGFVWKPGTFFVGAARLK